MEVLNVVNELKSRYLSTSQERIEDLAWRRYKMDCEEVNESLIALTRNGRLLKVVDKQVQFYRTVENSPQEHTVNNEEVTTGKLLEVVNLLVESMECFQEDILRKT